MKTKLFVILLILTGAVQAQKSLTLVECKKLFDSNNLLLLAKHYDIDISKAGEIQARTWDLPYFSGEMNLYNPNDKSYFNAGSNGQKAFAIEQLIVLGNKRHREVTYNKSNTELAEIEFEQLAHNLKLELEENFYSLYFDNKKLISNNLQEANMDSLISSYQVQNQKGNIPLKDLVRLQNISFTLKNDRMELMKNILSHREKLSLLTGVNEEIVPTVAEDTVMQNLCTTNILKDSLILIAFDNNPDYLYSVKSIDNRESYLKWQKSKFTPDFTLGSNYNQNGGVYKNELNLTFGIGLPLWNQNKGGVRLAKAQLDQSKTNNEYSKLELQTSVTRAYTYFNEEQKQYNLLPKTSENDLQTIYNGVLANFLKRNIGLIEFTDYMESYNQSIMELNEMRKQLLIAAIELNHVVSKEIVKP